MKLLSELSEEADQRLFKIHQLVQEHFARKMDTGIVDLTKHGYHVHPDESVTFAYDVKLVKSHKSGALPVKVKSAKSIEMNSRGITSLKNCPDTMTGLLDCGHNTFLHKLEGAPSKVGSFSCPQTSISDLVGGPKEVEDFMNVTGNPYLRSLEGLPERMEEFSIDLRIDLPLLRLPLVKDLREVRFGNLMGFDQSAGLRLGAGKEVEVIVNKHLQQGKPGVFKLHDALVDAGFAKNAKY